MHHLFNKKVERNFITSAFCSMNEICKCRAALAAAALAILLLFRLIIGQQSLPGALRRQDDRFSPCPGTPAAQCLPLQKAPGAAAGF